MAKTAWPNTTELTNALTGLGVTSIPTGVTLQDELDAAVEMLEELSGQSPFLIEDAAADFLLDPSRRTFLDLRSRWPSITSVSIDGTAQTANEDYWAKPYGGPYTSLEFLAAVVSNGEPHSVTVNGKRGYAATIPLRAWNAVLDYAAGKVYEKAAMSGAVSSGAVSRIKQDTVDIQFAGGSLAAGQDTASKLMNNAKQVMMSFRTPTFGGL
jgi:hypothetical protein